MKASGSEGGKGVHHFMSKGARGLTDKRIWESLPRKRERGNPINKVPFHFLVVVVE